MKQPLTLAFLYSRIKALIREVVLLRRENAKLWGIAEAVAENGGAYFDGAGGASCLFCNGEEWENPGRPDYVAIPITSCQDYYHQPRCLGVRAHQMWESRSIGKAAA